MARTLEEILYGFGIRRLSTTPHGFRGCCAINPEHYDREPSMHIHVEKGYVKCFSCGAFKSLFNFLIENGVPFDEAIDFFFTDFSPSTKINEGLSEWVLGRKIPLSMLKRGFTIPTLKHFGVGYDEVEKHITMPLKYKGVLYGIAYRIDVNGKKRMWSSDGFVKDNFIYNYEPTDIRVYCEGQSDTWKIWQNGTKNVSSTLMAYPTDNQLSLMAKHKEILLAFDNDKAGWAGAFRIHKELSREVSIKIIPYAAKDPDGCTMEEWIKAVENPVEFMEFEIQMIKYNPKIYEELKK